MFAALIYLENRRLVFEIARAKKLKSGKYEIPWVDGQFSIGWHKITLEQDWVKLVKLNFPSIEFEGQELVLLHEDEQILRTFISGMDAGYMTGCSIAHRQKYYISPN